MLVNFLTVDEILDAHDSILSRFGGEPGVIHEGAIHAAVERHRWGPFEVDDLYARAALLLRGICEDHPFADGNKRTAFAAAEAFMQRNGARVAAPSDLLVEFMLGVARGEYSLEGIRTWLHEHATNL